MGRVEEIVSTGGEVKNRLAFWLWLGCVYESAEKRRGY